MPHLPSRATFVLACLLVGACSRDASDAAQVEAAPPTEMTLPVVDPDSSVPPAELPTAPASSVQEPALIGDRADGAGDPAGRVAESTATLPPFPFFKDPEGITSVLAEKGRNRAFDREHMIAGDRIVAIEGKVFRDRFRLTDPKQREYSAIEFHRNYADAVAALGGAEVSDVQYTHKVIAAFGGRPAVDAHYHGACAAPGCENHTYLIRKSGREYWIQVSTGAIPLRGEVVVLEKQAMESRLAFLDAAAMKRKLDAEGRVALYINFDLDAATLRPDAAPVVEEIARLLQSDPALKLSIDGHTDNSGSAGHNRTLSQQRAQAVRDALVARGIQADRLSANGFGPDRPLADNADEDGRAKNRRVELVKLG